MSKTKLLVRGCYHTKALINSVLETIEHSYAVKRMAQVVEVKEAKLDRRSALLMHVKGQNND